MSTKRFAGLTIEQLNAAGSVAGEDAVRSAHAAGVASSGVMKLRFSSGDAVKALTRLHPDGTLEIVDERIKLDNHGSTPELLPGVEALIAKQAKMRKQRTKQSVFAQDMAPASRGLTRIKAKSA